MSTPAPPSTLASLGRLYRYAKPAMPRIYVAIVASLLASLVSLAIPQVLQWLIDGPLTGTATSRSCGSRSASSWRSASLEAGLIALRRWLVLTPGTHVEAHMRNSLYGQLQDLPVGVPRPLAERPAAVARHQRPQPDPPLDLVRLRDPRRERADDRRSASSSWSRSTGCSARSSSSPPSPCWHLRLRLREALLRRRPPQPGPGRATSPRPSRSRCTASAC